MDLGGPHREREHPCVGIRVVAQGEDALRDRELPHVVLVLEVASEQKAAAHRPLPGGRDKRGDQQQNSRRTEPRRWKRDGERDHNDHEDPHDERDVRAAICVEARDPDQGDDRRDTEHDGPPRVPPLDASKGPPEGVAATGPRRARDPRHDRDPEHLDAGTHQRARHPEGRQDGPGECADDEDGQEPERDGHDSTHSEGLTLDREARRAEGTEQEHEPHDHGPLRKRISWQKNRHDNDDAEERRRIEGPRVHVAASVERGLRERRQMIHT